MNTEEKLVIDAPNFKAGFTPQHPLHVVNKTSEIFRIETSGRWVLLANPVLLPLLGVLFIMIGLFLLWVGIPK